MSRTSSPSGSRPYGLARVCRVWHVGRSTIYLHRAGFPCPGVPAGKRGPKGPHTDADLTDRIKAVLAASPWVGEGHRKVWARLRMAGTRTSKGRVLRLMRQAGLLAPTRAGRAHGPAAHDGSIIPDLPDRMWGTDGTSTLTGEGNATIFFVLDHCTTECLGIFAARRGDSWAALEPLRQAVRDVLKFYGQDVALELGLKLRHDHGSQFMSDRYQGELNFLGIASSPSFVREPQGNGCAERFVRTLKEQLLWLRQFGTVAELNAALQAFKERYNHQWLIQRHGWRTPSEQRLALLAAQEAAA